MTPEARPFRVRTLDETAHVSLVHFDHPHGAQPPDSEEPAAERFQINIVARGWFRWATAAAIGRWAQEAFS